METKRDNPGVIAPPPLIFLSGLAVGGIVQWFFPVRVLPSEYSMFSILFGGFLAAVGLGMIFNVRSRMAGANTNIEPWKPTTALVVDGIYGLTRNPVYVALVLIYIGIFFIFDAVWVLPPLIIVLLLIHFTVVLREERYLEDKFGKCYADYKQKVRRWI